MKNGKNCPSIDRLFIFAEMLQVAMDDILIPKDEYKLQQESERA